MSSKAERLAKHSINDYLDIIEDLYHQLEPHNPQWTSTAAQLAENVRSGARDGLIPKESLDECAVSLHKRVTERTTGV